MILSAMTIIIRQSIMNSEFLELVSQKLQERIYIHLGILDKDAWCQAEEDYVAVDGCVNVTSKQYISYLAWRKHTCNE